MKRLFSFFLAIFVLCLCGCEAVDKIAEVGLPPVPTAQPQVQETAVVLEPATETVHQHIIINTDRTELEAYDPQQGTELILSFSYETPYVHIPGNNLAEDAINEFTAMISESYYTGDNYGIIIDYAYAPGYINMLTMAEDNYNYVVSSGAEGMGYELACHRTVGVERCDESILSLLYYDYVNLGGAHGSYAYRGYCFDTQSGKRLEIDEICTDSRLFRAFLIETMMNKVNSDEELQQRINGFVDAEGMPTLAEAVAALLRGGSWYLDNEGLVVFSDIYEMSSYAAGIIEFKIPYSELEGHLKPEYMPEEMNETGSFIAVPVEELSESSKEIIDMVKSHEEGVGIYLVAEGSVRDVRLAKVDYTDHFYETEQLWYCSRMDDCAVQLVTLIPEGMPELKISYRDAAGSHSFYLSQSGMDGSLILVDDSIEAVG